MEFFRQTKFKFIICIFSPSIMVARAPPTDLRFAVPLEELEASSATIEPTGKF